MIQTSQHYQHIAGMVCLCVFIPSPVREGSTFLVITGVQFFRTELKSVRKVSTDANLNRFQHKVF